VADDACLLFFTHTHTPLYKSCIGVQIHPGNYCLFDRQQVASGSCTLDEVACYVLGRVIGVHSERSPREILVDVGACALHKVFPWLF
jgi:D-serine deaminase-like pyridoxal phosphate-dependent protein